MQSTLLAQLEAGEVALRDLAGLNAEDIRAIEGHARIAFEARRYRQAATIFAGLEALEPDRPCHALELAYAEAEAGRGDEALGALERFLQSELPRRPADVVRGLLLRAQVLRTTDVAKASNDLLAARIRASHSESARAVLEGRNES